MIDSLYVFVRVENGKESVIIAADNKRQIPLITSDTKEMENYRDECKKLVKPHGVKIRLLHFTDRKLIEEH